MIRCSFSRNFDIYKPKVDLWHNVEAEENIGFIQLS